jgi:class 3 adenylate cyclase
MIERLNTSFAARLMFSLLGLVLFVAGTLLVLVERQTAGQVRAVTLRAADISRRAFADVEELHRAQLERLGRAFTESRRTLAALEASLESGEPEWLLETARYELDLARLGTALAAFTDARGRVVATLLDGDAAAGDPAGAAVLAETAFASDRSTIAMMYRRIGDRLFALTAEPIVLAGRPIGAVVFGVPIDAGDAARLGQAAGVEVCFVSDGQCIAGIGTGLSQLAREMAATRGRADDVMTIEGRRWVLTAEDVTPGGTLPAVRRVIAIPIDEAVAPFEQIRTVLVWTSLIALVIALLIGALLSQRLTRPVRALVQATDRIARGDLETRVPVHGRDELGTLARSFNTMVEGLALKERYRDVLQKVVSREIANDLIARPPQLGGEMRNVSVVFADIVGFTALAEGAEPAQVIATLNELMTAWSHAIEEEGGVVDKYTGDGIMAIFGAPIVHEDDTLRAVHAALRMQEATRAVNSERAKRGEPAVSIAIGASTGPAIAGNVGSPDRLNYTVIGETVNLAARLCGAAAPGEILISHATMQFVEGRIGVAPRGDRRLKGFSQPVPVFAVELQSPLDKHLPASTSVLQEDPRGKTDPDPASGSRASATRDTSATPRIAGGVVLVLASLASPVSGQDRGPGLPTLAGLGLSYISTSGAFQVDFSGRLDLEGYFPQDSPPWLIPAVDPFLAGRLRLFTDVFAGDHVYGMLELRADRGEAPTDGDVEARVEQVFLRVIPSTRVNVSIQAGKFATPFGGYAERHHTPDDPLVRPPLAYDYRTLVSATVVPGATAGFLDWKNQEGRRPRGAPPVWNVPYPWGAMLSAAFGDLVLRAAALSASPSSAPDEWDLDSDRLQHPSVVVGAAMQIVPELRLGVAYNRGPYIAVIEEGPLPPGTEPNDFDQEIWNAEAVFSRGRTTMRGEIFFDRWEVPNLTADPRDLSWYVETQYKATAGLTLAARWNEIRFNDLDAGTIDEPWDRDLRRLQFGAGYRILRNTGISAEYMLSRTDDADPRDNLFSVQWWWAF